MIWVSWFTRYVTVMDAKLHAGSFIRGPGQEFVIEFIRHRRGTPIPLKEKGRGARSAKTKKQAPCSSNKCS